MPGAGAADQRGGLRPDHPEVAITLANLGNVARDQGDLAEARRCQERALRINEAAYGPDHPEVAITLTNLGIVARRQGDLAEARRCQEAGAADQRGGLRPGPSRGGPHPGQPRHRRPRSGGPGRGRGARSGRSRIFEAAYGPDHPEVAITLTNLGVVARRRGPGRARWLPGAVLATSANSWERSIPTPSTPATTYGSWTNPPRSRSRCGRRHPRLEAR